MTYPIKSHIIIGRGVEGADDRHCVLTDQLRKQLRIFPEMSKAMSEYSSCRGHEGQRLDIRHFVMLDISIMVGDIRISRISSNECVDVYNDWTQTRVRTQRRAQAITRQQRKVKNEKECAVKKESTKCEREMSI